MGLRVVPSGVPGGCHPRELLSASSLLHLFPLPVAVMPPPPPSGCSLKEPTPSPCSSQSSLCQSLVVESPLHGTAGTAIQPDLAQGCAATKLSWKTAGERFPSLKVGVSAGGQCWSPGGGDSEPQHGRCRSVPLEPGGHSWQQGWKCSTSS